MQCPERPILMVPMALWSARKISMLTIKKFILFYRHLQYLLPRHRLSREEPPHNHAKSCLEARSSNHWTWLTLFCSGIWTKKSTAHPLLLWVAMGDGVVIYHKTESYLVWSPWLPICKRINNFEWAALNYLLLTSNLHNIIESRRKNEATWTYLHSVHPDGIWMGFPTHDDDNSPSTCIDIESEGFG